MIELVPPSGRAIVSAQKRRANVPPNRAGAFLRIGDRRFTVLMIRPRQVTGLSFSFGSRLGANIIRPWR